MKSFKYVILGSGVAAGHAVREFAQNFVGKDQLAIVTADDAPPYDRPPLSKYFLAGEAEKEDILINKPEFYKEHGIAVLTRHQAVKVDFRKRVLHCDPGKDIGFEKLLITTGSEVRQLDVPGSDLRGIYYLRSLKDSLAIRKEIESGRKAVVIGSGFIGMEAASVLARKKARTTMVFPEDRVWSHFLTRELSGMFESRFNEEGVQLLPGEDVHAFRGKSRVSSVELASGKELPADFVVAGIGVTPATSLFERASLHVQDGIVVDEFLETNIPDVWAAGDVANFPDLVFHKRRRIEHWDNAVEQGRVAARNMMAKPQPFIHVPYFFSDVFDYSWEFWGDTEGHDQVAHRGSLKDGKVSAWWLKEGKLVAAFVLNRPDEERELAPRWIMHGRSPDPKTLSNSGRSLRKLELAMRQNAQEEA